MQQTTSQAAPQPEPPEALTMLRHRFARVLEVSAAYECFRMRQVAVGPAFEISHESLGRGATTQLLVSLYSFLYSLFDDDQRAVHFAHVTSGALPALAAGAATARTKAIDYWSLASKDGRLHRIRHTVGFHGTRKRRGAEQAYEAVWQVHPLHVKLCIRYIAAFFRYADARFTFDEPRLFSTSDADADTFLALTQRWEVNLSKGLSLDAGTVMQVELRMWPE